MRKVLISVALIFLLVSSVSFASQNIALVYNVMPDFQNGQAIDSTHTNKIGFTLCERGETLYYNGKQLEVKENRFFIDTKGLSGENKFEISNDIGEKVSYTYYFSNDDGYLESYKIEELKNKDYKTYIKTIRNISVIYTEKDKKSISKVEKIILALDEKFISNVKEIKMIPTNHSSGAAGITKYDKITLYNISSYSTSTIKNIVIHEIAHTWAFTLMQNKVIDYSYSDYKLAVNKDTRFPSKYAKENVEAGNYNEDFAESISFYLINEKTFSNKYPARTEYIKEIIKK